MSTVLRPGFLSVPPGADRFSSSPSSSQSSLNPLLTALGGAFIAIFALDLLRLRGRRPVLAKQADALLGLKLLAGAANMVVMALGLAVVVTEGGGDALAPAILGFIASVRELAFFS